MLIYNEYCKRLNRNSQNLRPDALEKLVSSYPDHGFVIDRTEAKTLFHHVRKPTPDEDLLIEQIDDLCEIETGRKFGFIDFVNLEGAAQQNEAAKGENDAVTGTHPPNSGNGVDIPISAAGANVPPNGSQPG